MKKTKKNTAPKSSIPREMDYSYFSPVEVKVYNNFEKAFKIFRTLVQSERIVAKLKEKSGYEKPSVKKRRKHNETMQRLFEEEVKQKKILSGEFEKEKAKKQAKKEKRIKERAEKEVLSKEIE
jgi:ribosomal protein S21